MPVAILSLIIVLLTAVCIVSSIDFYYLVVDVISTMFSIYSIIIQLQLLHQLTCVNRDVCLGLYILFCIKGSYLTGYSADSGNNVLLVIHFIFIYICCRLPDRNYIRQVWQCLSVSSRIICRYIDCEFYQRLSSYSSNIYDHWYCNKVLYSTHLYSDQSLVKHANLSRILLW